MKAGKGLDINKKVSATSPTKLSKKTDSSGKKIKIKGDTSFIIEDMMS